MTRYDLINGLMCPRAGLLHRTSGCASLTKRG